MQLYSTANRDHIVDFGEAVMKGLAPDKGLYMPVEIPKLSDSFWKNFEDFSFAELSYLISRNLISENSIPDNDLHEIVVSAINFPAPLVSLDNRRHILELFHGPSLAFKDFGARFMAQTMSFFNRGEDRPLTILVATSGDTGGAVANGFYDTEGIQVIILYPKGKVSLLQEKQLTTLGKNITALEIEGTFDDCQRLVKTAFLDADLQKKYRLSSANSINIARLIPQSFYYFEAYKQLKKPVEQLIFAVPSGNFGNLTAGVLAKKMGIPVHKFIAATNINNVVPNYLATGLYEPKTSVQTISNAMDVGNPSNFSRLLDLFCSTWNIFSSEIIGYSFSDSETKECIKYLFDKYQYIIDPHGAVGYLSFEKYLSSHPSSTGIILETAHPSKFINVVEEQILTPVDIPSRLADLRDLPKVSIQLNSEYRTFKQYLNSSL